jgi:hypothetical protein
LNSVLVWNGQDKFPDYPSERQWEEVVKEEWLPIDLKQVIIQMDLRYQRELILATTKSFIGFLKHEKPTCQIEFISSIPITSDEVIMLDVARQASIDFSGGIVLASPCIPDGIKIPALWLQPFYLVTICNVSSDRLERISGPLIAQTMTLNRGFHDRWYERELASESHRLAASDLIIVSGSQRPGIPTSPTIWLIGSNDIALEMAIERFCGLLPNSLPVVNFISRYHDQSQIQVEIKGISPDWKGLAAPSWQSFIYNLEYSIVRKGLNFWRDLNLVRKNLWRISRFLRKKVFRRSNA